MKKFAENNEMTIERSEDKDFFIFQHPWGEECLRLELPSDIDAKLFDSVLLPKGLIALKFDNCYEFVYQPLHIQLIEKLENFEIIYHGVTFKCSYREVSKVFELIARSIKKDPYEETDYTNVFLFRSFFHDLDKDKEIEEEEKKETTNYHPINFFVEGDFSKVPEEKHIDLFRHINFYMHYYDRRSPLIALKESTDNKDLQKFVRPDIGHIPPLIRASTIDETLLLLLETARTASAIRLQYLFYYQVLEYCEYYYLDEAFKIKIYNILKSPKFFADTDASINTLIDEFQRNYNTKANSDSQRLERLISTYCNYDSIKKEISDNEEYFRNKCEFDGGYVLDPLLGQNESIDNPSNNLWQNLKSRIDNLRNVLVHVRESREPKSIAPTAKNSNLLKPYLFLIKRMAEEIASRDI